MITIAKRQFLGYAESTEPLTAVYCTEGFCNSSDNKPTGVEVGNGSSLVEMDTGEVYFFDAENRTWRKF